jgi:TonB family protein
MSSPTEFWKNWEGRVADEKFPLRKFLGGSDHSAVFLTERTGEGSQRAAIKLIPADNLDESVQLSSWATAAKLSHPHLIALFECGSCTLGGTRLLYVVMEYAEENLAEILPLRALAPAEVSEMLHPTAEALDYLHRSGLAHGRIQPSNIMAVDDQLKISADGIGKTGERPTGRAPSPYDAPEVSTTEASPAADMWSLGITLLAVLTQNEPNLTNGDRVPVVVPETIPQPFRDLARRCLALDPQQRCTAADIPGRPQIPNRKAEVPASARLVEPSPAEDRPQKEPSRKKFVIPILIVAVLLIAWLGSKFVTHEPTVPEAETPTASAPPSAAAPSAQSPAPVSESKQPTPKELVPGNVLHQVSPEISRSAQNTINGHVKVSVQVSVDASGNVSQAKFVSAGPSKYFADRALAAARIWKFTPPQVDGHAAMSEWILHFQFGRGSTQVTPTETKP